MKKSNMDKALEVLERSGAFFGGDPKPKESKDKYDKMDETLRLLEEGKLPFFW